MHTSVRNRCIAVHSMHTPLTYWERYRNHAAMEIVVPAEIFVKYDQIESI